ncbi:uncharacterized protein LOC108671825 [Hyalella azteca]|uniref:Uncharacterized protein LOC108671825 n=1 Tax=Hyalella azteca TaxID=294128 RepID=A0A8B7NMK2_HYAAZ|nr:uncharacterized protein LOC108671825 [Hyalella azteca]
MGLGSPITPVDTKSCSSSEASLLHNINEELIELYKYLEKHQVSGTEAQRLLDPLKVAVEGKDKRKLSTVRLLQVSNLVRNAALCAALVLIATTLWQAPLPSKLMLVAVRHIQMLVLPYWDWSRLYFAECLISNPFYTRPALTLADCSVCESEEALAMLSNVPVNVATDEFLRDDRPFVVTDAMTDWHVMNTDDFWFDNITELYRSEPLQHLLPCELSTNLRAPAGDLQSFLQRIHLSDSWYGHWENCDRKAAKALRNLYQRPYFMPDMVDFSDANWVLMSSDYRAKVYKEVRFQSEVLWLAVLRGWLHVRVSPQLPCNELCPELTTALMEGHVLVVTSRLWRLEYIPGEQTDNLAIAVGGFWN